MLYWELFYVFLKIGAVSFGGGYAMIPLIEHEVTTHGWMGTREFTDAIAIAGMSPGPIATNSAVIVGFQVAGTPGALISAFAVSLPSLLIVVLIGLFMNKMDKQHNLMDYAFFGLRPVITALIVYAAVNFSIQNGILTGFTLVSADWLSIGLVISALAMLLFTKTSPVVVILLFGVVGVIFYY